MDVDSQPGPTCNKLPVNLGPTAAHLQSASAVWAPACANWKVIWDQPRPGQLRNDDAGDNDNNKDNEMAWQ